MLTNGVGNGVTLSASGEGEGDQQDPPDLEEYWLLYDGVRIIVYEGKFGDESNPVQSFPASSGIVAFRVFRTVND